MSNKPKGRSKKAEDQPIPAASDSETEGSSGGMSLVSEQGMMAMLLQQTRKGISRGGAHETRRRASSGSPGRGMSEIRGEKRQFAALLEWMQGESCQHFTTLSGKYGAPSTRPSKVPAFRTLRDGEDVDDHFSSFELHMEHHEVDKS